MESFEQAIGVVAAVVVGFVVLTAFFKVVGKQSPRRQTTARTAPFKLGDRLVTVHLSSKRVIENVRLADAWRDDPGNAPLGFHDMISLERADGTRLLVRSKMIDMIEVPPNAG